MPDPAENNTAKDVEGPQDPLVERMRPDPSQPARSSLVVAGLLGDSDRPGHRRLYLTKKLDYFIEFAVGDVLDSSRVPSDRPPFLGTDSTQVTLKKGAHISYTRTTEVQPPDEFDLDLRRRRAAPAGGPGRRGPRRAPGRPQPLAAVYDENTNPVDYYTQPMTDPEGDCRPIPWTEAFWSCTCGQWGCTNTCDEWFSCPQTCTGCLPDEDYDKTLSCIQTACSPAC
ncbi:hypothetical protein OG311_30885 [Streptomyces sp. NBC_01343]|uniref:hypothetical protein n=1 Tax=Streptomyces sp. NBC_01343 TaxID=2903832 RepID=UPI002E0EC290|nr:hypothetical protein OG311_30885 [Streptomyces sp. NBC_01343]